MIDKVSRIHNIIQPRLKRIITNKLRLQVYNKAHYSNANQLVYKDVIDEQLIKSITEESIIYDTYRQRRQARSKLNNQNNINDATNVELTKLRGEKRIKKIKRLIKQKVIELEEIWEAYCEIKEMDKELIKQLSCDVYDRIMYLYHCCESSENYEYIKVIVEDMLSLNYEIKIRDVHDYLKACIHLKEYSSVENMAKHLINLGKDMDTFILNHLLYSYVKLGDLDSCMDTLEYFDNNNINKDQYTYAYLTEIHLKKNSFEKALELYQQLYTKQEVKVDTWTLNLFLENFVKYLYWPGIQHILKDMNNNSISPDLRTLTILLKSIVVPIEDSLKSRTIKNRYIKQQIKIINAIYFGLIRSNIKLDKIIFCNFIKFYTTIGKMNFAQSIIKDMKLRNIQPDLWEYSILMDGYCKSNKWQALLDIYKIILDKKLGINPIVYSGMLQAYTKVKKQPIEHILNSIDNKIYKKDIITFNIFIRQLSKSNKLELAYKVYCDMKSKNIQPDLFTFIHLYEGLKYSTNEESIIEISKIIYQDLINSPQIEPNQYLFNLIIYTFNKFKLYDSVNLAYTTMLKQYNLIPNQFTLFSINSLLLNGCDINDIIYNIINSKYQQLFYTSCIAGLIKSAQISNAILLYDYFYYNNNNHNIINDGVIYYYLIQACLIIKDKITIYRLFRNMKLNKVIIDEKLYFKLNQKFEQSLFKNDDIYYTWLELNNNNYSKSEQSIDSILDLECDNNKIQLHLMVPLLLDCYHRIKN